MQDYSEIQFERVSGVQGDVGLITLNRQRVLNAINHDMFISLENHLLEWKENQGIKAIIIRATEGRAFSAGGDIRSVYDKKLSSDPHLKNFFIDEYRVNHLIYHYPKPYIALLDGITMGGGAGISIHGSHRLATESMSFAMPETGIGFFPDIGSSYFLSRLKDNFGIYLGLTGKQIPYNDCYALGLVTVVINKKEIENIIDVIAQNALPQKNNVTELIKKYEIPVPASELILHRDESNRCFSKESVETILIALDSEESSWCQEAAKTIKLKSPLSLKVTLEELKQGRNLNFDDCMKMEYKIMSQFLHSEDFFEGIRAALVDKDRQPKWKPAYLVDVTKEMVEEFFDLQKIRN